MGTLMYMYILSMSSWWFIKRNNKSVFPDLEPPIIKVLYGLSFMVVNLSVYFSIYIKTYHFIILFFKDISKLFMFIWYSIHIIFFYFLLIIYLKFHMQIIFECQLFKSFHHFLYSKKSYWFLLLANYEYHF